MEVIKIVLPPSVKNATPTITRRVKATGSNIIADTLTTIWQEPLHHSKQGQHPFVLEAPISLICSEKQLKATVFLQISSILVQAQDETI